ncbi:hypothetical protein OE88DRAFT_1656833 [Heliocybe sulcata]|uniref:F-box domain-containing protein n=1 Tax=Heliocybe sulcata TaxID=5364 RepID=A0A5C3N5T6_9AGAM|nr:hypothetical protein OE88DRAFT_1656833 [Heliocybe sulcata]
MMQQDPSAVSTEVGVAAAATWQDSQIRARIAERTAKIQEYQAEVVELERCLNARLPIARLPAELLVEIFKFYMLTNSPKPTYPYPDVTQTPGMWTEYRFRIAQVCHQWREAALDTPGLWADIATTRTECFKELLRRSRQVPLSVVLILEVNNPAKSTILGLLVLELHRVRELLLSVPRSILMDLEHEPNRPSSAPQLRSLNLFEDEQRDENVALEPVPFVSTLSLPELRELEIDSCRLQAVHMLFIPPLTKITWKLGLFRCNLSHFLSLLRNTPLLSALVVLDDDPGFQIDPGPSDTHHVHLPHLTYLRVDCHTAILAKLLSHIEFPKNAELHLFADSSGLGSDQEIVQVRTIMDVLCQAFTPGYLRTFEITPVDNPGDSIGLDFTATSEVPPSDLDMQDTRVAIRFIIVTVRLLPCEYLISTFCGRFPLSGLLYLHVAHSSPFVVLTRRDEFLQLTQLTQLRVEGDEARLLYDALRVREAATGDIESRPMLLEGVGSLLPPIDIDGPRPTLFPSLSYLRLDAVRFRPDWDAGRRFVRELANALRSRMKRGLTLNHLDIRDAIDLDEEDEATLKAVVTRMTIQRREG